MLRIKRAQNEEFLRRSFRGKLYRFLRQAVAVEARVKVGSLAQMSTIWADVPLSLGANEHDVAVYMTFVWLATFDPEAARRLRPAEEAITSHEEVLAMKSYMADTNLLDMCAFDRA